MTEVNGVDIRHLNLFRNKLAELPPLEQFKKIATMFVGASYKMGSENFNECDCSGLICSSLSGMGYSIRINANDIIENCCDMVITPDEGSIVGFYDEDKKKYTHIGISFHSPSDRTILHSSHPTGVAFEWAEQCEARYYDRGYRVDYFKLNFGKVKQMDGKVYGLDEDFG